MWSWKACSLSFFVAGAIFGAGPADARARLKLSRAATLRRVGTPETQSVAAGAEVTLDDATPVFIESTGRVPLLVVPLDSRQEQDVEVSLVSVADWPSDQSQAALDAGISELTRGVVRFQKFLAAERRVEALNEITQLQSRYPKVGYLNFLRASVLTLQGDRSGAVEALRLGLASHPDEEDARKLLQGLGGTSP